jgi:hypothetical protein
MKTQRLCTYQSKDEDDSKESLEQYWLRIYQRYENIQSYNTSTILLVQLVHVLDVDARVFTIYNNGGKHSEFSVNSHKQLPPCTFVSS